MSRGAYRRHRAKGLCGACGKVPTTSALCRPCKKKNRVFGQNWRKKKGGCVTCGRPPAPGLTRCDKCRTNNLAATKRSYDRIKVEVINHYGGKCNCCGEEERMFLTIDHIASDGAEHRRNNNIKSGSGTYRWLKKNGFPRGFQVLCYNCNSGRHINGGVCPHVM